MNYKMMYVKAPGVIKLLGEHAVVYGKTAVAAAIDLYTKAEVIERSDHIIIELSDINRSISFEKHDIEEMKDRISNIKELIKESDKERTALLAILSNFNNVNYHIKISSSIPMQKGLASSAALSVAFATLLAKLNNMNDEKSIIEIARIGEKIFHENENAGLIDTNTSFYGGIVIFNKKTGIDRINKELDISIIDTGPKKSTAETVAHVANLYKEKTFYVESILDDIERQTQLGIKAIRENNYKELINAMCKDHQLLRELGVSTYNLDKVVEIAMQEGSGAKLSGGGGGGIAIALNLNERAIEKIKAMNFDIINAKITNQAAQYFLQS